MDAIGTPAERAELGVCREVERVQSLLERQELFRRGVVAHHRLQPLFSQRTRIVWFGLGIASRNVSRGLPVDVLVMLLAQEMLRRALGLAHSEVLLADENAAAWGWSDLDVRRATLWAERVLRATVSVLGVPVRLLRASSLPDAMERTRAAQELAPDNPYVGLQLAQMEAMRRRGAAFKLGWTIGRNGFDESRFDLAYERAFGPDLCVAYTISGRTLDPRRPRACPYVCAAPGERILLAPGEPVADKLRRADPRAASGYTRLLAKIHRAHAHLHGTRAPKDAIAATEALVAEIGARMETE